MESKKELTIEQQEALLSALKERFEKNMHRHEGLDWEKIEQKLKAKPEKLCSLNEMERTEGEPDVVGYDEQADQYIFCDCSKESPKGRRSVCYDRAALEARKKHKPKNSAMDMANEMGIEMLTEKNIVIYRHLRISIRKLLVGLKRQMTSGNEEAHYFVITDMGMYSSITMEPILTTPQEVFAVC